jgi:hypothetical protein
MLRLFPEDYLSSIKYNWRHAIRTIYVTTHPWNCSVHELGRLLSPISRTWRFFVNFLPSSWTGQIVCCVEVRLLTSSYFYVYYV